MGRCLASPRADSMSVLGHCLHSRFGKGFVRSDRSTEPERSGIARFIPVTVFTPLFGSALGIDGGPLFQILAIENLALSPTAIGIAFGFGVISLPVQLYASRMPLQRARQNVQRFLMIAAVQAWMLAALIALDVTGPLASTALAITVTAEIALSVLFATAWQPLLSHAADTTQRQRLSTTWPAVGRALLAVLLVLFAALDGPGRAGFLTAVGLIAVGCAFGLQRVPDPPEGIDPEGAEDPSRSGVPLSKTTRSILVVFAAINIGALPLWLVYLDTVLWPNADLGVVAAIQTAASMLALLAWRPTKNDVTNRAFIASIILLGAVLVIPFAGDPGTTPSAQVVLLAATAIIGAAGTTVRVAMLETAHRTVNAANSVRAFTVLDVVASTSLQVGLLASGFLIAGSARSTWPVDPYLSFVIAGSVAAVIAVRLSKTSTIDRPSAA